MMYIDSLTFFAGWLMDIQKKIRELKRMVKGVRVETDPIFLSTYNYDATQIRGSCTAVAFPESKDELSAIVRVASRLDIPVYLRGAGSGFSGGSIPSKGGLVVSTEKLSRVISFTPDSLTVKVESGVINGELQRFLGERGYFYPPDPASMDFSTIGGNIAENSGGPRAFKYGVTRRYVRGMEWISSSGEVVESTGDAISSVLIGSEGTLGVIYSAELTIMPLPEAFKTVLIITSDDASAMIIAQRIMWSDLTPSVLEFIDSRTIDCVAEYLDVELPVKDAGYLFVEFDGLKEEVDIQFLLFKDLCATKGVQLRTARNEAERELLWKLRRSISPSLARRGVTKVNEDVSLPAGSLVEGVQFIHELASELNLDCYIFGHCGDGNLHVNIMTDRRKKEEMKRVEEFVVKLFEKVVELDGSLSGEHGIGLTKSPYLRLLMSDEQIGFERAVSNVIEPAGILNPGKYFDIGA